MCAMVSLLEEVASVRNSLRNLLNRLSTDENAADYIDTTTGIQRLLVGMSNDFDIPSVVDRKRLIQARRPVSLPMFSVHCGIRHRSGKS